MKKLAVLIAILLMISLSLAYAAPRSNADSRDGIEHMPSEGLTMFTNVGVVGTNVDGVPGYIQMTSSNGKIFYLYIDDMNFVRIASGTTVGTSASPNVVDWSNAGEIIGRQ